MAASSEVTLGHLAGRQEGISWVGLMQPQGSQDLLDCNLGGEGW